MKLMLVFALMVVSAAPLFAGEWDKYIWEHPGTAMAAPNSKDMREELRSEIQKVLDAGPLAPHRTVYADLVQDEYFLYWQPGRIITTLAMAYPHLAAEQQKSVRDYVRRELDDRSRAPWCSKGFIAADNGARRELHGFDAPFGFDRYWGMWGRRKPTMGAFYGLWLYAQNTGDWDALKSHYDDIVALYRGKAPKECVLYGTMGAHVAMARIAEHFGDAATMNLAVEAAERAFESGRDFAAIEKAAFTFWPERADPRQNRRVHQGWMFLDLCPEVGLYLADRVKEPVLARHGEGLTRYPLFWLRETPYGSRWTGDEGQGIPTELMGMIVPIERWVAGAPPERLARYTRSAPICIGDCYWIESLIHAIDSTGGTKSVPVRRSAAGAAAL